MAAHLKLPVASYVNRLDGVSEKGCDVHRITEDGEQSLSVEFPALLTVVKEVSDPRLPTFRGKLKAKTVKISSLTLKDLGIAPSLVGLKGSPTRVVRIFKPKVARECEKLQARTEEQVAAAAGRMMAMIAEKGFTKGARE